MWLRNLQADRLRNLAAVDVDLAAGLTVLTGRNGHGKTSLLEALYLLATGYSFRTRRIEEVVHWEGGPMRVGGRLARLHGEFDLAVVVDGGVRRLVVDGAETDLEGFIGRLDLVAITAEVTRVLREGPEARRRFIDGGIVGLSPGYLRRLSEYRRTLESRNALLRKAFRREASSVRRELDAWDEHLATAAARIHAERRRFVLNLGLQLGAAERSVFPEEGEVHVRYRPSPPAAAEAEPAALPSVFLESMKRARDRDLGLGFTGEGPHRDDLRVDLGGVDLRKYGSSGQVRAAMIALSVGKLLLLKDRHREAPLLLMDDFDSDLDEARTAALVKFLHEGGFQAILATSKEGSVDRLHVPFRRIRIEAGTARAT